jgi:hypothetical protein
LENKNRERNVHEPWAEDDEAESQLHPSFDKVETEEESREVAYADAPPSFTCGLRYKILGQRLVITTPVGGRRVYKLPDSSSNGDRVEAIAFFAELRQFQWSQSVPLRCTCVRCHPPDARADARRLPLPNERMRYPEEQRFLEKLNWFRPHRNGWTPKQAEATSRLLNGEPTRHYSAAGGLFGERRKARAQYTDAETYGDDELWGGKAEAIIRAMPHYVDCDEIDELGHALNYGTARRAKDTLDGWEDRRDPLGSYQAPRSSFLAENNWASEFGSSGRDKERYPPVVRAEVDAALAARFDGEPGILKGMTAAMKQRGPKSPEQQTLCDYAKEIIRELAPRTDSTPLAGVFGVSVKTIERYSQE